MLHEFIKEKTFWPNVRQFRVTKYCQRSVYLAYRMIFSDRTPCEVL